MAIGKSYLFSQWQKKADKFSSCPFPILVGAGGLFSRNTLLLYCFKQTFTTILFKFFKIGLLKNFTKST